MSRLSFRTKLQLVLVSFAVVLIGSALLAVRRATLAAVREKIEHDFAQTRTILGQQTHAQIAALDDALATALGDPVFRSQLGQASNRAQDTGLEEESEDRPSALLEAHEIFLSADLPLMNRYPGFAVLNADGQRVFSKANPARFGDNMSRLPIVQQVRAKGRALQLWDRATAAKIGHGLVPSGDGNAAYLLLARQVESGGQVLGFVLIAESLSEFMAQLERSSGAHVGFVLTGGSVVASNPKSTELIAALGAMPSLEADQVTNVTIGGEVHLALGTAIADADGTVLARAFFARSFADDVGRLLSRLDVALLLALALSLLASLPLAAFLARWLTGPLASLERATKKLELGDFSAHAEVTSQDELGRVGRAFNEMMVALRERNIDRLTGAYNSRYFVDALEAQILRSDTLGAPLSLVLIDIDHFRALNERHGRDAADSVLKTIARMAHEICHRDDVLARYAADELVLLLQDADGQVAESRAKELQAAIAARRFVFGTQEIAATISAGVVSRTSQMARPHDLLRELDKALYAAKTAGRNRVVTAA